MPFATEQAFMSVIGSLIVAAVAGAATKRLAISASALAPAISVLFTFPPYR